MSIGVIQFPENISDDDIHTYMAPLYNDMDAYKDELIYVSLGGKVNERILTYRDSDGIAQLNTNSLYQMIPSFLHNDSIQRECILKNKDKEEKSEKYKCLCVIVDSFLPEELERNIQIINHYSQLHDMSNIKVYIINNKMHTILDEKNKKKIEFLKSWLYQFCDELKGRNINSENFMLCNYIKFKHTNNPDYEVHIKRTIEDIVKEKDYQKSHYEWFGYANSLNYLFYNFVYLNGEFDENVLSRLLLNIAREYRDKMSEIKSKDKNMQIYYLDWKRLCLIKEVKEKIKCIMPITHITHYNTENSYADLFSCVLYDVIC
jgi:hypothetical protein